MATLENDSKSNTGESACIVIGHPDPSSFSHGIAKTVEQAWNSAGLDTAIIDLYADDFDPRLNTTELDRGYSFDPLTQKYIDIIEACSYIAFIYPEWWGLPPAILKGFIDRVWITGVAYEFTGEEFLEKQRQGLLGHLDVMILTTTDAEPGNSTNRSFWSEEVFPFSGIVSSVFETMHEIRKSSYLERKAWLEKISGLAGSRVLRSTG